MDGESVRVVNWPLIGLSIDGMATEIDVPHLGAYLSVPEAALNNLIAEPTGDLVATVLRAIAKKAQEHAQVVTERLKLEVELENSIRTADLKTETLRSSVEKSTAEVAELRKKLLSEGIHTRRI